MPSGQNHGWLCAFLQAIHLEHFITHTTTEDRVKMLPMKRGRKMVMMPVRREVVSPAEYKRIISESPSLVERARFIAPVVGERDYGAFELHYSVPMLRRRLEAA
jgi:hypothetical protein